jgi:hypothetical protein
MSETAIIQFLVALVAPFMAAYALGYFIRKSIKFTAGIFGFFFFLVGIMWYYGVLSSLSPVQNWVAEIAETGLLEKNGVLGTENQKLKEEKQAQISSQETNMPEKVLKV